MSPRSGGAPEPAPEFVRRVDVEALADGASRTIDLAATAEERALLARRFGLLALDRFEAKVTLRRSGRVVRADIAIAADVVQQCVVTLEPIGATVAEHLVVTFQPQSSRAVVEVDVDVDVDDDDPPEPLVGHAAELGEPAAEALGLVLDPYPRKPDVAFEGWSDSGDEGPEGPFAALARLKP
ncbi:MAG: YceD family protein [Alphaproteobacteria bacterium]